MRTQINRNILLKALIGVMLCGSILSAQAAVLYNTNLPTGGDNQNGDDGALPPSWVGSATPPVYGGSMSVMWYADLQSSGSATLSTADASNYGAPSTFILYTGPAAWNNKSGHGLDYGLIQLEGPSNLTVTVSADPSYSSQLRPGFSLYQGWDTGSSFSRTGVYTNNVNNPLGTVGLAYLNQANTTTPGGTATYTFTNLSGNLTLMLGGSGGTGAAGGYYQVTLASTPVPIPAAVWLFGSALAGLGIFGRRKGKEQA